MKNFLPVYQPSVVGKRLQCEVRNKDVRATPEEVVRQRVLHWLIQEHGWDRSKLRLEKSYPWLTSPNRRRIRPDIELLDEDDAVLVVVECKRPEVPLNQRVDDQAIEYAIKSSAPYIWTTNGDSHKFLRHTRSGGWKDVGSLEPLDISFDPPKVKIEFPDVRNDADIARYFKDLGDPQFQSFEDSWERHFVLAMHKVLFNMPHKLPYSYDGVHVLEDRGTAFHMFTNRGGGAYYSRYRDFFAATQGRVEALSVAVNWSVTDKGNARLALCVGASKVTRVHHALQLIVDQNCEYNESKRYWNIYHNGRMSNIKDAVVLDAVREAAVGHWIDTYDDGRQRIHLGKLYAANSATWKKSREFIARLLHYGIIRTNLRETLSVNSHRR